MLTWLVVLALLWPLFWCIRVTLVTRFLMGLQWRRRAEATALNWEELPEHVREAAQPWVTRLEAVGFRLWGGAKLATTVDSTLDEHIVVLTHSRQPVRAIVAFKGEAEDAGKCWVSLRATTADGSEFVTRNYTPEALLPPLTGVEIEYVGTPAMEELLQRHLAQIERLAAQLWRCPDLASALRREVQIHDTQIERAQSGGFLVTERDGAVRYAAGPAVRRSVAILRDAGKRKKAPAFSTPGVPELSAESRTAFDLQQYRQIVALQRGRFSRRAKAVLGVGSFVAFAAVLGWQYSFTVAATLVVALVVHEGGHLLAMRLFGFRDLQLLFIPFFGGAAVGMDDRVLRPWQHIAIILAGPMPGIFAALAMFAYGAGGNMPEWFNEAALTTLVLNAFNLLPVLPLDGGQIVDYAVAARFPRARVVFVALSALGILLMGAALDGVKLLIGVGVMTLMRLPTEWRLARVNRMVREEFPAGGDEEPVVRSVLAHLRAPEWAKTPISQRLNLVRGLQNTLRMPRPGFGTIGFAALGFTAPLWLGMPLLLWAGIRQNEARTARAEARAIAAGFARTTEPRKPSPRLAPADNAAVKLAEAVALNSSRPAKAASRDLTDPRVIALLREAARRPGYEPLPRRESEGNDFFGHSDETLANLLCLEAEEKLRYREMAEAADVALDTLRLQRLLQSAPEQFSWGMHVHTTARAWHVLEEAFANGVTLPAETVAELRRLADDQSEIAIATVAIPEDLWGQARAMLETRSAQQGFWLNLFLRLSDAGYKLGEYREQLIDQAILARQELPKLRSGRWPARATDDDAATALDRQLRQLALHITRLRLARVALAAMEIQRHGGAVTSLESLGFTAAQLEEPFTHRAVQWTRRGAFWVLDYAAEIDEAEDVDGEEGLLPLTWRIPASEIAARVPSR